LSASPRVFVSAHLSRCCSGACQAAPRTWRAPTAECAPGRAVPYGWRATSSPGGPSPPPAASACSAPAKIRSRPNRASRSPLRIVAAIAVGVNFLRARLLCPATQAASLWVCWWTKKPSGSIGKATLTTPRGYLPPTMLSAFLMLGACTPTRKRAVPLLTSTEILTACCSIALSPLSFPGLPCTLHSSGREEKRLRPSGPCSGHERRWPVRAMRVRLT
jgi:hypothetical protein